MARPIEQSQVPTATKLILPHRPFEYKERMDAVSRLILYFGLTSLSKVRRTPFASHYAAYPRANAFWLCRRHPWLLHDLLWAGGLRSLSLEAKVNVLTDLAADQPPRSLYGVNPAEESLPPVPVVDLEEYGTYELTCEQLEVGLTSTDYGVDDAGELRAHFSQVYASFGYWGRSAVDVLCRAAVKLSSLKWGLYAVGPSTIPGAGLGLIAVGTPGRDYFHYDGLIKKNADVDQDGMYNVFHHSGTTIDGSHVFSLAASANGAESKATADGVFRVKRRSALVVADLHHAVQNREVFMWYGYPGATS